ncbi:MAG: hypothetical protein CVV32_05195 [Methanomicrobiales archaeon HGW-Methanomicrobiales-3]|jgi:hypothetical protein|nr:MAG: hypothetical protein CVV32_05195 [Methanomicrobiales archaeon HGW-Methanomicrobiales-3]
MTEVRKLPLNTRAFDQYQRVKRWFERFKAINEGSTKDIDIQQQYDDVLAFFMNCYHLKDWLIKEDEFSTEWRKTVEQYISINECLQLCADIANGTKHFSPGNIPTRSGQQSELQPHVFPHLKDGILVGAIMKFYLVLDNGESIDAFNLAADCMKKWEDFMTTHKIFEKHKKFIDDKLSEK